MREEEGDDDATRLRAVRARDPDVWVDLYNELYPRLRSFFIRRIGPDAAEDAVAETLTRALSGIDRYSPGPAGLPGWMQAISRGLPPSYVFDGMRAIVAGQPAPWDPLMIGGGLAVLYLILACLYFTSVYRYAIRTGLIARYSAESVS